MVDLVLLGGGGHCISILDTLYGNGDYNNIAILDPQLTPGDYILNAKVYGSDDCLNELINDGCRNAFVSIGSIKTTDLRRTISKKVVETGFRLIKVIDNSAVVSDKSSIAEGVFVGKRAVINANVNISNNSIINTATVIDHGCQIGEFSHIACSSTLCGDVVVGNDTFIGAGTTVIEGRKIGDNVIIGAGSLVLRDIQDNEVVFGIIK